MAQAHRLGWATRCSQAAQARADASEQVKAEMEAKLEAALSASRVQSQYLVSAPQRLLQRSTHSVSVERVS
jgi:hypothetical protein